MTQAANANNSPEILSATQLKDAGKRLHSTKEYADDPHQAIKNFVEPFLDAVHVGPAKLLVATYRQQERTAGGLMLTNRYLDEDKFQGITGLVLKLGALSFTDDARIKFGGFACSPWQWVIFKPENGRATELRGLHCRIIEDVNIDAIVDQPDLLW